MQALKYNVSFYVVGFVIGTAPLCTFLLSPVFGFFVSETVYTAVPSYCNKFAPCNKRPSPYFDFLYWNRYSTRVSLSVNFLFRIILQSCKTNFKMESLGSRLTYAVINRRPYFREKSTLCNNFIQKRGWAYFQGWAYFRERLLYMHTQRVGAQLAPCNKRPAPYFDCHY